MPSSDTESMKRVLDQIMELCRQADGNSLNGLMEQPPEQVEEESTVGGEGGEGDAEMLMALKRKEDGV